MKRFFNKTTLFTAWMLLLMVIAAAVMIANNNWSGVVWVAVSAVLLIGSLFHIRGMNTLINAQEDVIRAQQDVIGVQERLCDNYKAQIEQMRPIYEDYIYTYKDEIDENAQV